MYDANITELTMNNLKAFIFLLLISTLSLLIASCSDDATEKSSENKKSDDHVWKTQTDALKSAKEVTKKMQETIKQQQEQMDENN